MFFFANVQRSTRLIESSVGPCPFCQNVQEGEEEEVMDLIEQQSQWHVFGCCPTNTQIEDLVQCRNCGQRIKASYYTLRPVTKNHPRPSTTAPTETAAAAAAAAAAANNTTSTPAGYSDTVVVDEQDYEWNEIAPLSNTVATATGQGGGDEPPVVVGTVV